MRPPIYIAAFLAVMALAFWAYRENYATQQAQRDLDKLDSEITALHEALAIQRAEWAYLNRPDRLRELVTLNYDRLGLLPLQPDQLGSAAQVAYPGARPLDLSNPVDV
ncbi:MAG: cell division protein FtsL, partial [Paracoccaceae bacterium]